MEYGIWDMSYRKRDMFMAYGIWDTLMGNVYGIWDMGFEIWDM